MKFYRIIALALACGLALSACSKAGGGASGPGGHNPWTQPGVIRLGEPDEPDSINPLFGHTVACDEAATMIFSYLMRYDDNGNFIPDLAQQVPTYQNGGISKDGKTITFHLRHNAKWSDGTPLTSKDWMFTLSAVRNRANNVKAMYGWDDIATAQAPDPYTIVVHLKQPNSTIMGIFAMGGNAYPPLPAHLLAKYPDINRVPFNQHPVSSGPYVLKQWNHGASLVFVPNQYYFRGAPKVKEVLWKVIPNVNTLFEQLQTHEIDVYSDVDQLHIPALSSLKGYTVTHRLIANWRHMMMNTARPLLRDVRVRQAIAQGIDWKRINDTIYHGYNQLAVSDIFPQSWAAPNIPPYQYDPAKAKQLLADAGWKMGSDGWLHKGDQTLQLSISTNTDNQPNNQAEVQIQSALKQLGIDIQIRNYPTSLLFAQDGPLYQGKYDLEWSVATNAPDPDNSGNWNSKYIPPNGGNTAWLKDPIIDRTSSQALLTYDQAKRKALYQQEEEEIHKVVPAVFFYWENSYTAMNTDLKNYKPAAYIADMWNCWEWTI